MKIKKAEEKSVFGIAESYNDIHAAEESGNAAIDRVQNQKFCMKSIKIPLQQIILLRKRKNRRFHFNILQERI